MCLTCSWDRFGVRVDGGAKVGDQVREVMGVRL